nr:MAG TPA: hypothetical protein [Caudoviricetes sp.]
MLANDAKVRIYSGIAKEKRITKTVISEFIIKYYG